MAGRPPLPVGAHGKIRFHPVSSGGFRAIANVRDADGVTRPVERSGKSKAAAERALKTFLRSRLAPDADGGDITADTRVTAVVELFLAETKRRRKGTTYDTYAMHARNHVVPSLGQLRVREVTVARVDTFLRACEARLSANTARSIRTVVSGAMALAARRGAVSSNPVRDAGHIEGTRKPVRALLLAERVELLEKLDADEEADRFDMPDLVRFMLATGCRIGEVLAVEDEAVDWEAETVAIVANIVRVKRVGLVRHEGKSFAAQRVLPLPGFALAMLAERRPSDVVPGSMVFPNSRGHALGRGSWRDPHNTGGRLRTALDAAGFEWVTSHVFRKTAATVLDQHGLTARAIAGHIGHARPSITQDVYMDKRAAGREAADALGGVLGSAHPHETHGKSMGRSSR